MIPGKTFNVLAPGDPRWVTAYLAYIPFPTNGGRSAGGGGIDRTACDRLGGRLTGASPVHVRASAHGASRRGPARDPREDLDRPPTLNANGR
jgi:hypothetical protein